MLMQVSMLPSSAPEYSPTYSDQPLLFSWLPAVKFSPILRARSVSQLCSPQLMFFLISITLSGCRRGLVLLSMFQQEAWFTWPFLAQPSGSFFRAVHDFPLMQHALPYCYCHFICSKTTRLTQIFPQPAPCSS